MVENRSFRIQFFFNARAHQSDDANHARARSRRNRVMCLYYYAKLTLFFLSQNQVTAALQKLREQGRFPSLTSFRTLRVREESLHGGEKQAATKTIKRRGTDESKPNEQRVEEDLSGGRYWFVQKGTFSFRPCEPRCRKLLFWIKVPFPATCTFLSLLKRRG